MRSTCGCSPIIFSSGYIDTGDDQTVGLGLNYLPTDANAFVVEVTATLDEKTPRLLRPHAVVPGRVAPLVQVVVGV